MSPPTLSVEIPALDEEAAIGRRLTSIGSDSGVELRNRPPGAVGEAGRPPGP